MPRSNGGNIDAKLVYEVLHQSLQLSAKRPNPKDPALTLMAQFLEALRLRENEEPHLRLRSYFAVASAISTIAEELSPLKPHFLENLTSNSSNTTLAKQTVAAFDALVEAAQTARDHKIPLLLILKEALSTLTPEKGWHGFVGEIEMELKRGFPTAGVAARRRFISAIIPRVSGEQAPNDGQVKTYLFRLRQAQSL